MNFLYDFAVMGGDLRQVYLAGELVKHAGSVGYYALCREPEIPKNSGMFSVKKLSSLAELSACSNLILPIPCSKNGSLLQQSAGKAAIPLQEILKYLKEGQRIFGGCIPEAFALASREKKVKIFDLMEDATLAYYNTIATAEGVICEAIRHCPYNLRECRCLVLGYGKCASTLTMYLKNMFSYVWIAADVCEEQAKAAVTADQVSSVSQAKEHLNTFDVIFNTIPAPVLTEQDLSRLRSSAVILDIASAPGGIDASVPEKIKNQVVLCPGLPGRFAPASSAKAICETIQKIIKKEKISCP